MLLPTILFYAPLLLPLTMAVMRLTVLVPDQWKDIAVLHGKNSTTGVPWDMRRASANPGSGALCPNMIVDTSLSCDTKAFGIAKTAFSQPTTDPRPIRVILPDYTLQCNVTVKDVSTRDVYWYVEWGTTKGGGPDVMRIVCTNGTHT